MGEKKKEEKNADQRDHVAHSFDQNSRPSVCNPANKQRSRQGRALAGWFSCCAQEKERKSGKVVSAVQRNDIKSRATQNLPKPFHSPYRLKEQPTLVSE